VDIHILETDPAVELAGYELARCLGEMTSRQIKVVEGRRPGPQPDIYLGTAESLGEIADLLDVDDPRWDDAYTLRSVDESLVIAGVNPRSVLMGVYGYLRELGAEWLWPGADGEVLPQIDQVPLHGFDIVAVPPNRHRGVCMAGAPALEHVLDMVEWMPKVGLNTYFLQFQVASYFWRLWYEHDLNPTWSQRRELTDEECEQMDRQVICAVKERGLLLHQVGHGWTAAALGLPSSSGWVTYDGPIADSDRELLAQVNGKREIWGGVPMNTELCYGNPEARRRLLQSVLDYAREHPEVDALHFWLSDAPNNHCECELCRDYGPWDWYATLLNELSARLNELAPEMKIVFLAYHDLLWPPEKVKLDLSNNNLIIMFAPITRCYAHRLAAPDCGEEHELVRPARNEMQMPTDNPDLVQLWRLWDWSDRPNSFVFDYHFIRPWLGDRLSLYLAELMPEDIADFAELGLGGLVNCATERIFYPTGWPYYLTARLLWGELASPEDRRRYFTLAYGESAGIAQYFLDGLVAVNGASIHHPQWWQQVESSRLPEARSFVEAQRTNLEDAAAHAISETQTRSWQLLLHYRELVSRFLDAQYHRECGAVDEAMAELEGIKQFVQQTEPETARALDAYVLLVCLEQLRRLWAD